MVDFCLLLQKEDHLMDSLRSWCLMLKQRKRSIKFLLMMSNSCLLNFLKTPICFLQLVTTEHKVDLHMLDRLYTFMTSSMAEETYFAKVLFPSEFMQPNGTSTLNMMAMSLLLCPTMTTITGESQQLYKCNISRENVLNKKRKPD